MLFHLPLSNEGSDHYSLSLIETHPILGIIPQQLNE